MMRKTESARAPALRRDPFTFSLGGIRTIASVVPAPAIAAAQMNRARNDRGRRVCHPLLSLLRRSRVAANACP